MRPKVLVVLLALGFLGAVVQVASASVIPASSIDSTTGRADSTATRGDSTTTQPDTTATHADTSAVAPVAPVAPVQAAAPASTPPPAAAPAAAAPAAAASASAPNDRIYYGGTVTLSFGSTTRIGVFPMLGYKLTPKISGGVEVGYEYLSYNSNQSSSNYGGGVFGRYRVGRNLYAYGEYRTINYEIFSTSSSSSREWVPALLLGGGYSRSLGGRTSVYAEVLFDVLQDDNSPYKTWEPVVNFGVATGF